VSDYSVPENGVKDATNERKYNKGCLSTIKCEKTANNVRVKVKVALIK